MTQFHVTCLSPRDNLFGVVADQSSPFNALIDLDPPGGSAHIAQLSIDDFSTSPYAFEALDALILSGVGTSTLTDDQIAAAAEWVASGGELLLTGGPTWDLTLPAFQHLMPFIPTGTTQVESLNNLAEAIGAQKNLDAESFITIGELVPGAVAVIEEAGIPILIRRNYGSGAVSVLTADPTLAPLKDWAATADFYRLIFPSFRDGATWSSGFIAWNFAREAVSIIPGLDLPPFAWICGLLFLYIMVVGPVNYWLLRRWNRREFAWISIPLLVVIFTILTYAVGRNTRGNLAILNRLAIVQSWPETGTARIDALIGVFSPDRATYDLAVDVEFIPFSIPSDFNSTADFFTFIQSSSQTKIPDIHVEIGGIEALGTSGVVTSPQIISNLNIHLSPPKPKLIGEIILPADLDLKEAVLLAPGAVQQLGDLQGGQQIGVDLSLESARATQGSGQNPTPYSPNLNTVESIIGTSYYAGFNDPEISAKIALLNALMDPFDQRIERENGVFLVGWTEDAVVPVRIENANFETLNLAAHIIAIPAPLQFVEGEPVSIPPGLFQWEILDYNFSRLQGPYDVYLDLGGELRMKYNLDASIHYSEAVGLTLHLEGDQNPSNTLSISLWDFSNESWEQLPLGWGSNQIEEVNRFVRDHGEIRVRVENSSGQTGLYIERLDFSLTVIP